MKKVFIGVIAALMLFAFVACDSQVPQIPSQNHKISTVQFVCGPLSYTVGESFDPSAYEVKLVYLDNMSPETVNGDIYLSAGDSTTAWPEAGTMSEASVRVPVYAAGMDSKTPAFYVTVYNANVVVDITNAVTEVPNEISVGGTVSTEGLTATLVNTNGDAEEFDVENLVATYAGDLKVDVDVKSSLPSYNVETVKDGVATEWTVTAVKTPSTASQLIVEYTLNDAKTASGSVSSAYLEDTVDVAVFLADSNNNKIKQLTAADLRVIGEGSIKSDLSYTIGASAVDVDFYYDNDGTPITTGGNITLPAGTDWIKSVSEPTLKANTTFKAGTGSIDADDFEATATMASNKIQTTGITIVIVGGNISLTDVEAGEVSFDLQVSYTSKDKTESKIYYDRTVTVEE